MTASLFRTSSASWLRRGAVFLILIALMLFFTLQSERFLQVGNLGNVIEQNAYIVVAAIGVALTMILNGIDLSVGSVAALAGAITAGLMVRNGWALAPTIIAGLLIGLLAGAINGALVVFGKLPPFVVTLAMLGVARGLMLVYTEGRPIAVRETDYMLLSTDVFGNLPMVIVIALLVTVCAWLLMTRTQFGLHIYAVGGNEETARLAGVPVERVKILTYAISGMCAAIAGIMLTAQFASAQPRAGDGLELTAIAAAVLGGVSLFGGIGNVFGLLAGVFIVGVLSNGMNLLRIDPYPKQIIQGIVLVLAVSIDMYTKRIESR
ncbi:MAG: ABC transporter permease [Anaerolinea sp.]|nr:ABC transporter permease [Anaerolinea sp.]